jgi:hypothetical protein
MRWMPCIVSAKSGTSFDLMTTSKRKMTLKTMLVIVMTHVHVISYLMRPFKTHNIAIIHPTVVSDLIVRQLNSKSSCTSFPATRTVKTMRTMADT